MATQSFTQVPWLLVACGAGHGKQAGLATFHFDADTGRLALRQFTHEGLVNPLFVQTDSVRRGRVFVADFQDVTDGVPGGAAAALRLDAKTGKLTFLNQQPLHGTVPCYLTTDPAGEMLWCANYGDGTLSALPIQRTGKLKPVQHWLKPVTCPASQQVPGNAHCVQFDPAGRFMLSTDLGQDRIFAFAVDNAGRDVKAVPHGVMPRGSGPRHLAFHPNGRWLYAVTEYGNTVIAMDYDTDHGQMRIHQVVSTLPQGLTGKHYAADVQIHPCGRWLYASNRGHHSIALFSIDPVNGSLFAMGHHWAGGDWPRSMAIHPDGRHMIVGNEHSHRLVVLNIDTTTGQLSDAGVTAEADNPVAVAWA
ncbi:MAG: lactonase family protein [Phycisphaeraceae bacterium]|nr:lactonase family protein [Phycisphaeraceae bacterium]